MSCSVRARERARDEHERRLATPTASSPRSAATNARAARARARRTRARRRERRLRPRLRTTRRASRGSERGQHGRELERCQRRERRHAAHRVLDQRATQLRGGRQRREPSPPLVVPDLCRVPAMPCRRETARGSALGRETAPCSCAPLDAATPRLPAAIRAAHCSCERVRIERRVELERQLELADQDHFIAELAQRRQQLAERRREPLARVVEPHAHRARIGMIVRHRAVHRQPTDGDLVHDLPRDVSREVERVVVVTPPYICTTKPVLSANSI